MVLCSGDAEQLAEQTILEHAMLGKVTDTLLCRVFLLWRQGPTEAHPQAGWLTILVDHENVQVAREGSPVLRRLWDSLPLASRGCIEGLPALDPTEAAKTNPPENRNLLATRRGPNFYRHLFEHLGLLGRRSDILQPQEAEAWDFVLIEPDAGCGDALRLWLERVEKLDGPSLSTRWVGAVPVNVECRSNVARHRYIQDLFAGNERALVRKRRSLVRQPSATDS